VDNQCHLHGNSCGILFVKLFNSKENQRTE
jgi:hypothetical protein